MTDDPLKQLEDLTRQVHDMADEHGRHTFQKYPLTFSFLGAFGFAAIIYGFNKSVEQVQFFKENPLFVLVSGIIILLITGRLYKKLS